MKQFIIISVVIILIIAYFLWKSKKDQAAKAKEKGKTELKFTPGTPIPKGTMLPGKGGDELI